MVSLTGLFKRKAKEPSPAQAAALAAHDPYADLNQEAACTLVCEAIRDDKLDVIKAIHRHHAALPKWIAVAKGSSIGGEPIATPVIVLAAAQDRANIVQWMLQEGADIHARCNVLQAPPLFYAARNGQAATVRLLLDAGADPRKGQPGMGMSDPVSPEEAARWSGFTEVAAMIAAAVNQPALPITAARQSVVVQAPRIRK